MKPNQKLRLEWRQDHWSITDPHHPHSGGVRVDGAIVNVTRQLPGVVEGYVVSVHGLDMTTAEHLTREELAMLGVGVPARGPNTGGRPLPRLSLGPAGKISRGRP